MLETKLSEPWKHNAVWSKSDRESQTLYDLTYMWNLKTCNSKQRVECGGLGLGAEKWREVDQMGQILSYKIISSGDLTLNIVTIVNNTVLYTGKSLWE